MPLTATQAKIALINKQRIRQDIGELAYEQLGDYVKEISEKQVLLNQTAFTDDQETEVVDYIKRILHAKEQSKDAEEFKANIWGILNQDSYKAEKSLIPAIEKLNQRQVEKDKFIYRRRLRGKTNCEWCEKLNGDWDNHFASNGVSLFVRHKGCDCEFSIIPASKAVKPPEVQEMTVEEWKNQNQGEIPNTT